MEKLNKSNTIMNGNSLKTCIVFPLMLLMVIGRQKIKMPWPTVENEAAKLYNGLKKTLK